MMIECASIGCRVEALVGEAYCTSHIGSSRIPKHRGEYLMVSAIKYPWGEVVTGLRHYHVIQAMALRGIKTPSSYPQGFVSNKGTFYERDAAREIARYALQVEPDFDQTLYSEDLW